MKFIKIGILLLLFLIPFILGSFDVPHGYYGPNFGEISIDSGNANLIVEYVRFVPELWTMVIGGTFLIAMASFRRKKFFK